MSGVIAEKQRQCQLAKEQHDQRIAALSRQARRQRGRKSAAAGGAAVWEASPAAGFAAEPQPRAAA